METGGRFGDTVGPMNLTIGPPPDPTAALDRLHTALTAVVPRIVACSGGVDSLVLATVAHRADPVATTIAHTVTPAVPGADTARVAAAADREGWTLEIVRSTEFDDERYLANPVDRCYHCKSHLYDALESLTGVAPDGATLLSGANLDDLGEHRPGLTAATEHDVRHPFVEAGITKAEIRSIARRLGMPEADLPASPCLASRLYTGTRVTATRLRAVEVGEALIRSETGIDVVRCRVRDDAVLVEVGPADRARLDDELLGRVASAMRRAEPGITSVRLDDEAYAPGRAFVSPSTAPTAATATTLADGS